jgi:hypothetical protein
MTVDVVIILNKNIQDKWSEILNIEIIDSYVSKWS